ncbi:hypothetical protein LZK73_25760 (plasmid) [Neorhizobium galegae]|nr:hypothetical protein LZK73_25760 [Neorhizobium galegae]
MLTINGEGLIAVTKTSTEVRVGLVEVAGPMVARLVNLHFHHVQRAMAGIVDLAGSTDGSFWTWRDTICRLVGRDVSDDIVAVARKLYSEHLNDGLGRARATSFGIPAEVAPASLRPASRQPGNGGIRTPVLDGNNPFMARLPAIRSSAAGCLPSKPRGSRRDDEGTMGGPKGCHRDEEAIDNAFKEVLLQLT